MVFSKRLMLVVMSMCFVGSALGSDQKSLWNRFTGWAGSYFGPQPVQSNPNHWWVKPVKWNAQTPQEQAFENIIDEYGCNSNDPEALCNINIPKIELREGKGPDYEGYITKRTTAKKPIIYDIRRYEAKPIMRSYLRKLFVPRTWDYAMDDIEKMQQERPELIPLMVGEESVPENFGPIVNGVQTKMEEPVVNKALANVEKSQNALYKALGSADDMVTYAQQALEECSLKHHRSKHLCGGQEMYLKDTEKARQNTYNKFEPDRKALQDADFKLKLRRQQIRDMNRARRSWYAEKQENKKWADFLYRQEMGEYAGRTRGE